MVKIANPIYDVVFKYLMEDKESARLLLSAIIGKEIVELEFRPTERLLSISKELLVLRLDFSARVRDESGKEELIIMELQKAKLPSDIMRFRRYLGKQYSDNDNVVREPAAVYGQQADKAKAPGKSKDTAVVAPLPILSIYFLGHILERVKAPVLWVNRVYKDMTTGEPVEERESFVECLTHDSIIIQLPYLEGKRRTDLECLLALFDQSSQTADRHFLQVDEEELPELYRPLLRRLQMALADDQVRQSMEDEDDIIEDLKNFHRHIEERDQMLKEKERVIGEKERVIGEKDILLEEQQRKLKGAVRKLHTAGTSIPQIAAIFDLAEVVVEEMLKDSQ